MGAATLTVGAHPTAAADRASALVFAPSGYSLWRTALGTPRHSPHHADRVTVMVHKMVAAGNRIARLPYVYGDGHGSFSPSGYDCSGSVSYVLHAAGLLSTPEDSGELQSFGAAGPGRHVTIYANGGHAWMTIDGRRFDTIALQETGTRWSSTISPSAGYVVRHPPGL